MLPNDIPSITPITGFVNNPTAPFPTPTTNPVTPCSLAPVQYKSKGKSKSKKAKKQKTKSENQNQNHTHDKKGRIKRERKTNKISKKAKNQIKSHIHAQIPIKNMN